MMNLSDEELILHHGARLLRLGKGELIFSQGEQATQFYIVKSGKVKMSHFNEQGREFIQGYFSAGQSFGEPPLIAKLNYPASAFASEESEVWKMPYEQFVELLKEHFEIHLGLLETLSERLIYKSMMLSEVAVEDAEHRLQSLLGYLKKERGIPVGKEYPVPFTRQQLADMTGLRVETVIRTIKSMEQKGILDIIEGKIFWLPKKRSQPP